MYISQMKNKSLILAGIGLGSALTVGALSMASANEATTVSSATPTFTARTMQISGGQNVMFSRAAKPAMMHMM